METGMTLEPVLHGWMFVGGIIVYHQMQLKYLLDESEPYIPLNSDDVLQIIRSQGYFVCFAENEDA